MRGASMGIGEVLARNLKALRASLTQRELAERAGIHIEVVRGIEQGRSWPERENLEKLAAALRVQPTDFFITQGPLPHTELDCFRRVREACHRDEKLLLAHMREILPPKDAP